MDERKAHLPLTHTYLDRYLVGSYVDRQVPTCLLTSTMTLPSLRKRSRLPYHVQWCRYRLRTVIDNLQKRDLEVWIASNVQRHAATCPDNRFRSKEIL